MTRVYIRLALVLGLITAVGPFAIDMYIPALPIIGGSLGATPAAVQMTLTVFFITVGACQLVFGPLSDMYGRKSPIYAGLTIFMGGSIGCALAPSVEVLIAFRAVQAFGACAGMVTPRAIVRDLHTGVEATRLMALLMLVFSVSPILAPLTGSGIIAVFGWRGVFWAVSAAAAVGLFLAITQLKETRAPELRAASSWTGAFRSYRVLLADPMFVGLALVSAFGISSFFVYLANSSFVLIGHYGVTPTQFSFCFALNAVAFIGTGQMAGWLTARFGLARVIRWASPGSAAASLALAMAIMAGADSLPLMMALLFVGYAFLGLVLPTTSVLAMERHGAIAGAASAMLGSIQMVVGSCAMAATALFAKDAPLPMAAGIAAAATAACVTAQIVLWPGRRRARS